MAYWIRSLLWGGGGDLEDLPLRYHGRTHFGLYIAIEHLLPGTYRGHMPKFRPQSQKLNKILRFENLVITRSFFLLTHENWHKLFQNVYVFFHWFQIAICRWRTRRNLILFLRNNLIDHSLHRKVSYRGKTFFILISSVGK